MDVSYIVKINISDHKSSASSRMQFNLIKKKLGGGHCYTLLQSVVVGWFVQLEGQLLIGCKRQSYQQTQTGSKPFNTRCKRNKSNLYWNTESNVTQSTLCIESNVTQSTLCIESNVTQSTVSIYADCCLRPKRQEASLQFTRYKRSKSNLY